ncbi:hypothetical protein ISS07_00995 [Candidatus Woesearchaeota archaeon]|nr:hypothetical protein [Candidatus Woesearchaeota archaeon]
MRVGIEKRYADSYKKVIRECNNTSLRKKRLSKKDLEKVISNTNLSAETKKKKLMGALHGLMLNTLSAKSVNLPELKKNAESIREIINKIISINHYLGESLLKEIKIVKNPLMLTALKSKNPQQVLRKQEQLSKNYLEKIEHTIYTLIKEIIIFDDKLLKNYKEKEIEVFREEVTEIKDIEKNLHIQSMLLEAMEVKIPPAKKAKLLKVQHIPELLALLSNLEAEYTKEKEIFSQIKNKSASRKEIKRKIRHVISEKEKMLKAKEKRVLSMDKLGKITTDHQQAFHQYVCASEL